MLFCIIIDLMLFFYFSVRDPAWTEVGDEAKAIGHEVDSTKVPREVVRTTTQGFQTQILLLQYQLP